uniref:Uncharacterized protein n=1 Tax=Sphaeramia orbicularis TaxID=375764 RepID=A0A673B3X0_9TELE
MFLWVHVPLGPCSCRSMFLWVHVPLGPCSFRSTFLWVHVPLGPCSSGSTFLWVHVPIGPCPCSSGSTFLWVHVPIGPCPHSSGSMSTCPSWLLSDVCFTQTMDLYFYLCLNISSTRFFTHVCKQQNSDSFTNHRTVSSLHHISRVIIHKAL